MPRSMRFQSLCVPRCICFAALCLALVHPAAAQPEDIPVAPLLEGMGTHHHPISTEHGLAQRFFDQGLVLAYGFNHLEAERSFREAARLDPDCAMCWWGVAFVRGPNINSLMDPESVPVALEAMTRARALASKASPKERDFIAALATRYVDDPPEDRSAFDLAYANAMREVARKYPEDSDAATLFAASLMDTTPWNYWDDNGDPSEITTEVMATLEAVLERDPNHPGAAHFYIHIVEKERPQLAEEVADRLRNLVPGAGHLVHMPSHIYLRIGRYHDATVANQKAVDADDRYITRCRAQGLYPIGYMPHNWHYIWYAASVEGRRAVALDAARQMSARIDHTKMRQPGFGAMQHFWITPLYGFAQFGDWEAILRQPEPPFDLIYPRAVWRFTRGLAHARTGRLEQAAGDFEHLVQLAANPELEKVTVWDLNTTAALVDIAVEVLRGEIAAARGEYDAAVEAMTEASELEDELTYDEPPPWYKPVRQSLGAVLLEAGRFADAERVYRQDLRTFPANGWSLLGLARSLEAQGHDTEAAEVSEQFEAAWTHADIELTGSRF